MAEHAEIKRYEKTVVLKPSTEFLTDEYPLGSPSAFLVVIFYGKCFSAEAQQLEQVFRGVCKFAVSKHVFSKNAELIVEVNEVAANVDDDTLGVFIIVLCKKSEPGYLTGDDETVGLKFMDVWTPILEKKELNRRPKMFMYQVCDTGCMGTDDNGNRRIYDTAAPDADFLLISRHITARDNFMKNFCEHIKKRGKYVDIVEAAMFAIDHNRPLIVSTLTARFFPMESVYRDYTFLNIQDANLIKDVLSK